MNQNIFVKPSAEEYHYPIFLDRSWLDCSTWLPEKKCSQIVIITDNHIKKLYGLRLQQILQKAGHHTLLFSFPAGEKSKTYKTKQCIEHAMHQYHCDRDTLIVALGGGVVGDLAGFIAATFLRGIAYMQVPTSLLAMVDSSIGGKTGINTPYGKNLIGCIYHPLSVLVDTLFLKSLPNHHLINGLIECVKMFLTHDANSFHYAISHLDSIIQGNDNYLNELIVRTIRIKAAVVTRDEKDGGERATLNFGHTIGHALEKLSHYTLLHGFAVAYGILIEATISHLLGLLDIQHLHLIKMTLTGLGIHGKDLKPYDFTQLIQLTKHDKKIRLGKVNYVLLKEVGRVHMTQQQFVHAVDDDIVKQAFEEIIEE